MPEHGFEDSVTHYAYDCIHNFFDIFGLEYAWQYTNSILHAATRPKVWKMDVPSNLLFYIEKLKGLCISVFKIHHSYVERKEAIIAEPDDGIPDISVTTNFLDQYHCSSAWSNFPRHLTAKQYHNPYKAIKKFCTYMTEQEWNKFLNEITEYALSKGQLDDIFPSYNILVIRTRLLQLIDACHLVDVRTNKIKTNHTVVYKKKEKKVS